MRHSRPSSVGTSWQRRIPVVAAVAAGVTVVATFAGCSTVKPSARPAPGPTSGPGAVSGTATNGTATNGTAASGTRAGADSTAPGAREVALRQAAGQAADGELGVWPVAPGAGRLPQTQAFPSTHDAAFRDAMGDLWLAVTKDRPDYASQAFFPEAAYVQTKAIAYAGSDWLNRLWLDFELDVHAAHNVVGGDAHLIQVDMAPDWEAGWVPPGYCYNAVGYWHINGARLVYERYGAEHSIGVASLISWRGVWYVVHFGGVIRPAVGIVDDPEPGPGYTGPAGGC
jgi:hypothetical protein